MFVTMAIKSKETGSRDRKEFLKINGDIYIKKKGGGVHNIINSGDRRGDW